MENKPTRRSIIGGLGTLATVSLAGCSDQMDRLTGEESDEEQIRNVIATNVEATNEGDKEKYMSTVHPDAPTRDSTMEAFDDAEEILSHVEYDIEEIEIIDDERAEVEMEQRGYMVEEYEMFDNWMLLAVDMRTSDGEWYMYGTTYIDGGDL